MQSIEGSISHLSGRIRRFLPNRSKDFWRFEASVWLSVVGSSVISIFIPILMLQAGYTFNAVLLFLVIFHAVSVVFSLLSKPLIDAYDAKLSILIGTSLFILFLLTYSFIQTSQELWQLLILGILIGAYDAFYYVPLFYIFIGSNKKAENTGENTGILNLVIRSAALVGPVIGSSLLLLFESNMWAIIAAITILIASLFPLYKIKSIDTHSEKTTPKFREFFSDPREKKNYVSLMLFKIHESAEAVLWPIFIFLIIGSLESVAGLAILVSVTALVFSYAAGHIKKGQREKVIMCGSFVLALIWLLRMAFDNPYFLYGSVLLTAFFILLVKIPLEANIFGRGREHAPLSSSVYKNTLGMAAKGLLYVVVLLLSIAGYGFNTFFFIIALLVAGISLTNYLYMEWRKEEGLPLTEAEGRTTDPIKV